MNDKSRLDQIVNIIYDILQDRLGDNDAWRHKWQLELSLDIAKAVISTIEEDNE